MNKAFALIILVLPLLSVADERILSFHSQVNVMLDGSVRVTETIEVRSEGNRIRRGIYRDLPTDYFDRFNNRYVAAIKPLAVLRNELHEDFHIVNIDRGIRVYFGHSDRSLPNGVHRYSFSYEASRMLGFFDDHDELYWNVTGFDWVFPIDHASASVSLDFDVESSAIGYEAYTGPFGSRGQDYDARRQADASIYFEANGPLSPVNGLTIVVSWPKGSVVEPTELERVGWLLKDNVNLLVALAGLTLLIIYYIPVWRRYGKDPDEGVLVTRYRPPDGFSPASLRYVRQMYYDDKVMTAAVVNLAVKGYLRIDNDGDEHSLSKLNAPRNAPDLAPGENELYQGLFTGGNTIILKDENHAILGSAKTAHSRSLKADYKDRYFKTNGILNLPGIAIVLGSMTAAFNVGRGPTFLVIGVVVLMFLTMAFFAIVMKRPTLRGRKLLDAMLGFKDYLEVAEKEELNLRNPPEKTPHLFESYLPFALALGVDQQWSEKFASVLAAIRDRNGDSYQPAWYGGSWDSTNMISNTSSLSSGLNSAISSSVTPPGSSSGSGGGGSSGGGGGGGGGGGW